MNSIKNKLYIAIFSLIAILSLSVFVLWQVFFAQLDEVKNDYIAGRKTLFEVEQKTDLRNELRRELDKAGEDISTINSAFLKEEDKLDFIQGLEELGASTQNNYDIGNVREIANEQGELQELEFNATLVGSFDGILTFMRELKAGPHLVNITQYSLEPQSDNISANLTFKVYFE